MNANQKPQPMARRRRTLYLAPLLATLLLPITCSAQETTSAVSREAAAEPVNLEIYKGPGFIKPPRATYPTDEERSSREGWVDLNFMIDPAGKPYEIAVVDSMGSAAFERTAVKAIEQATFRPATLGNTPIHSSFTMRMKFSAGAPGTSLGQKFVSSYRNFVKALEANDRQKADELLPTLQAQNLYEDAYRNLGLFQYHRRWGTVSQQLAALRAAVAEEEYDSGYLGRDVYRDALNAKLTLEMKTNDYGRAMFTWAKLRKIARKEEQQRWEAPMNEVLAARADSRSVRLSGEIEKGPSWFGVLYKNRFNVMVLSGKVSEIKLRCRKQYVFFHYDPALQYSVKDRNDFCAIEIVGEPGTKFELLQT